jgi:NAD(P)-dependent dehydrogenase (short-subunit alcohol dehydrogenase family)
MTDQQVAIITGGSSGIGRATAIALAKDGVKVSIAARHATEGEETVHSEFDVNTIDIEYSITLNH